ncbi:fumarylacetoacetate hydrolase family protein [Actinomadura napierensis]|uniref:Fumarylacetoacetate hydrolase family protein n=1 Tax=Actinomadura napierensis TaxID=267854 RepID=A0ABN2XY17_9ACTN
MPQRDGRFALGTFAAKDGDEFAGLVAGDRVRPLDDGILPGRPVTVRGLLEQWDAVLPRLGHLAGTSGDGDGWLDLSALRVLPPLKPRQIIQAGANYRAHLFEMASAKFTAEGMTEDEAAGAARAEIRRMAEGRPFLFIGLPAAMCGPYDDVVLPQGASQPDWEVELTAVIGRPARHVPVEEALDHVAAYTVCNDISARDWQFSPEHRALGGDWLRAKNQPTFLPTGPFIVPAHVLGDPGSLQLTMSLNGQVMQDDTPDDMVHDVARLVAEASASVPLFPGDLILTGSPRGNGGHWNRFLRPGDVIEAAIGGIGAQRNRCVST